MESLLEEEEEVIDEKKKNLAKQIYNKEINKNIGYNESNIVKTYNIEAN